MAKARSDLRTQTGEVQASPEIHFSTIIHFLHIKRNRIHGGESDELQKSVIKVCYHVLKLVY